MANGELLRRANLEIDEHNGIRAAARAWGVTHGMVARAANGGNSPTLRRLWGIPKHPPRERLIMNCPPELKALLDTLRANRTRAEFLDELLDYWRGEGEMRV